MYPTNLAEGQHQNERNTDRSGGIRGLLTRLPPVPACLQELRRVMEGVVQLRVPLAVKVKAGERWGSMEVVME